MASRYILVFILYLQVVNSQYYNVPASNYPSYSYNYYVPMSIAPAAPTFRPTYGPTFTNVPPKPAKTPKRSISTPPTLKSSQPTARAYFLTAPSENVKATILIQEKLDNELTQPTIPTPVYSCPLCNNFADVPPNPKIPPPPPIGSPVLPGIIEKVPTIVIPKDLTTKKDPISILPAEAPLVLDMYEKHKLPKNLSFDQELLEGFLTGLGIAA